MLLPEVQHYISEALQGVASIAEERKSVLRKISEYVQQKISSGQVPELIYVCTHNSRRSHLGQIWGKVAAAYYGLDVNTYSAGTEATAFNPNAIKAVMKAGLKVQHDGEKTNPLYSVLYDPDREHVYCFSKTYEHTSIPKAGLCAIMTCTEADGNCPFIPGTELRVSCPYTDPKAFDGTPLQDEKYEERCLQIATENLYLFSLIKPEKSIRL